MLDRSSAAWLALILGLLLTAVLWRYVDAHLEERTRDRFTTHATLARDNLLSRVQAYEQVLHGGAALFAASDDVGRSEWAAYVAALHLERSLPGIQGTGFTLMLLPAQLEAHVAAVRAEGFPDYTVHPPGYRDRYSSIVFLEPFDGRNRRALGYDMYSQPVRREAMERARDTYVYEYIQGERCEYPSKPPRKGGTFERLSKTRQPFVRNTLAEREALGLTLLPGTEAAKSSVNVPIIGSDRVIGVIIVQSHEKEYAFSEAQVRLLQTVASSMGVALENARLLQAEQERVTELAVINNISQALTQELDLQALADQVGDKLRSELKTENLGIGLYDGSTSLLSPIYVYREGQRVYPDPAPLNALSRRLAKQGPPLVMNDISPENWEKFGSNLTFGPEILPTPSSMPCG